MSIFNNDLVMWLAQNRHWMFSGIGVLGLLVLWWSFRRLFSISSGSPAFHSSRAEIPPENLSAAPIIEQPEKPKIYSLDPRICFVRESENGGLTEGGDSVKAALATFRMTDSSAKRGTYITAGLSFYTTDTTGAAGSEETATEIGRVRRGLWIDENLNSARFDAGGTKELMLVMGERGRFVAVQNNRDMINRFDAPSYWELEPETFFVDVTLAGEIHGELATYTYKVATNPLKVTRIIRV